MERDNKTARTITIWVSPEGSDTSAGTKARPVRTAQRAVMLLRQRRRASKRAATGRILFRGGMHFLRRPLLLDHRDSGTTGVDGKGQPNGEKAPTILAGAPGERATLSAGRRITGFKPIEIHGCKAWVASIPAVRRGTWNFTQLWVNGRRADRPRRPETGTYRVAERLARRSTKGVHEQRYVFQGDEGFRFHAGEVERLHNLRDVEFVALHFWIESRIPLASVDEASRTAMLAYRSRMNLTDNHTDTPAPYYLDNVFEALARPGQWYLDRPAGKLYYVPRGGERMETAEVIAPVLGHVARLAGDAAGGRPVQHVMLENLTISHNEHAPTADARQATPQAACHVSGAIQLIGAEHCELRRCTVEHVGSYAVEIVGGSADCPLDRCHLHDLAAGGVKVFHSSLDDRAKGQSLWKGKGPWLHCRRITISDCHIHDGGHRWRQAVGVLVGNCSGNKVLHNHIHDFDYTGVSVGWTWGYRESNTCGNIIEWNHIHDIGRGVLSDMGGVYTLGQQQGTRIRYNHIHHIDSRGYGGWGIYPDEGSTDVLIECNLVHDTKCAGLHQHYGRNNLVRNNIFAFGRQDCVAVSRFEPHSSLTFVNNIVLSDQPNIWSPGYNADRADLQAQVDRNVYWCTASRRLVFQGGSLTAWRRRGFDRHSVVKDPGFRNAAKRDFGLDLKSPATKLGFLPFDLSDVGPRE